MKRIALFTISLIFVLIVTPVFAKNVKLAKNVKKVIVVNDTASPVPISGETTVTNTVECEVMNSTPVPVTIDGNISRIPFQRQQQSLQVPNTISVLHDYQVPDDSTLVIESFSVYAELPSSQVLFRSSITTTASGEFAEHHFDLTQFAEILDKRFYRGIHSVRLYADPGTTVTIEIAKQDVATGTLTVFSSISGYLVPVGATSLGP